MTTAQTFPARPLRSSKKKTYQRAFLAGPRSMSVFPFLQTCREDLLDPTIRLPVTLSAQDHAHSTQRDRLTRKAGEPEAAACVSVLDCTRIMTSPAQNFLKAALRAAMFAQCADRRPR